jgi:hypothetical protein
LGDIASTSDIYAIPRPPEPENLKDSREEALRSSIKI